MVRFGIADGFVLVAGQDAALDEVVCDISKWLFKDTEGGGSACYGDASGETICAEAQLVVDTPGPLPEPS